MPTPTKKIGISQFKIPEIIYGQVITYCEQINTGTKLVAHIQFHKSCFELVRDTIKQEQCKAIFEKATEEMRVALIYKYGFVKLLIKQSLLLDKEKPTALDVWVAGQLFGYSNYEIAKYLEKHGYVDNAI